MSPPSPPPQPTTATTSTTTTLPTYLSLLSPHIWYDYTQPPAQPMHPPEPTNPNSKSKSKSRPPTALTSADILTLSNLLPSTRPLLSNPKFLKALDLSPEELANLVKQLKQQRLPLATNTTTTSTTNSATSAISATKQKPKSKLDLLRESELHLAKKEAKEDAKQEKKLLARRKREIDSALGLSSLATSAGTNTGTNIGINAKTEGQTKYQTQEDINDPSTQETKKRRIAELDQQLGLTFSSSTNNTTLDIEMDLDDDPHGQRESSTSTNIDTDNTSAIRRAAIDVLLGLVEENNRTAHDTLPMTDDYSETEANLISKAESTRRRIDKEMGLLNTEKIAQMDVILGLLSPRKKNPTTHH